MPRLVFGCMLALTCRPAQSQDRPPAAAPRPSTPGPRPPISIEQLAERLQAMEEQNKLLAEELKRTRVEHEAQMKLLLERLPAAPAGEPAVVSPGGLETKRAPADEVIGDPVTDPDIQSPVPDYTEGRFAPFDPVPPGFPVPSQTGGGRRRRLNGSFGPGFRFESDDEEFQLQVHYESQLETRVWSQRDQLPANSGFFLPRQRIFFNGHVTKAVEYELSINRGFGNLNLLNAYINIHLSDQFELRFGRFFTPMPYDQYAISNYWLPTPERSIFTTNLSLNRQFGLMGWGYLFDKRLDYAAGVFNGSRNSFESLNDGVDFVGYLNARPFQETESIPFARFLNIGASVAFGHQDQAAVPVSFRIGGGSPTGDVPGHGTTPFLILNRDVIERGNRLIGSAHLAYFYKSLSVIGEWQYGYGGYASPSRPVPVSVPFSGLYISSGYFLTGEQVERRTRVTPLRPFIPTTKGERRGPGAWELAGRVSRLGIGDEVFTAGFSDPKLWSNGAYTTELGVNWYWNEYIKIYMFWLRGSFDDPVQYRPGHLQDSADLFWLRFQLYF